MIYNNIFHLNIFINLNKKKYIFYFIIMSNLHNEYLDDLIKKNIFKDFEHWNKNDFHFLLSLLNYQNYTDLALTVLINLKNWITYSNGNFFYPIEKIEKILDKYYINHDIFNDIKEENIKLNINKKIYKEDDKENDFINLDLDNGNINFGDFLTIDTFKFFICMIIFFIIISLSSLFSINRISDSNYIKDTNLYPSLRKINNNHFENLFNDEKIDLNYDNNNLLNNDFLKNILNENNISPNMNIFKKIARNFLKFLF